MIESFKINCYPLNRSIRTTIHLPNDYNKNNRYYPVIYLFDGQTHYLDNNLNNDHSIDLENIINKLSYDGKDAIFISIAAASNEEKRNLEYNDTVLADFIINTIHPYLNSRYRMNSYIYTLAYSKAALNALKLVSNDLFKGIILISPIVDLDKVKNLIFNNDKLYYFYYGKKELNGLCHKNVNYLKSIISNIQILTDDNELHNEEAWKKPIYEGLNYIVL